MYIILTENAVEMGDCFPSTADTVTKDYPTISGSGAQEVRQTVRISRSLTLDSALLFFPALFSSSPLIDNQSCLYCVLYLHLPDWKLHTLLVRTEYGVWCMV